MAGVYLATHLGAARAGETALAAQFRATSLEQLGDQTYAEYYQPMTGAPLGSLNQSWTAAAALDWLLAEQ